MVDPDRPTSADVPEFPPDRVRAGDLVFFAGGDDLSRMLAEVDGVILTQVGIALGDGTVVSCRTDGTGPLDPSAGGGVRRDALAWWREDQGRFALVGRIGPEDLAPDRPEYAAVRDRAARFARRCLEHPTWFSATKTVLPVLAIGTMPPFPEFTAADGAAMVDLAVAAGDAWRAGAEQPVYAGSEFVATALDTRFTRHDLQPKSLVLLDSSDDRPEPDYRDLVVAVLAEQRQTVATSLLCDLADRLQRHHPTFMPDVVGPLAAIVADPDAPSPTRLREAFHRPVPAATGRSRRASSPRGCSSRRRGSATSCRSAADRGDHAGTSRRRVRSGSARYQSSVAAIPVSQSVAPVENTERNAESSTRNGCSNW